MVDPSRVPGGTRVVEKHLRTVENRADAARFAIGRMVAMLGGGALVLGTIRTLASFEQALSTVGAVSGATAQQMDRLREAAAELGATTRFTATNAAEGLLFLARAGFSVEEQLATINPMLRLAQVGALDLGRAADIATNVLAGFGLSVSEAARFADVLAKTANSSNTNIQQLGDAFKLVAPVAAGVGVSLEEASAAIGKLSDAGLQATMAGTGLRRVISELESPSNATQRVLSRLGLSVGDVRVSSVGLTTAMERLNKAGITAGEALEVFGDRGGPAAIVLAGVTEETRNLTTALQNSQGYAEQAAKIMDDNLNGSLLKVKSAFEAVILSVGQAGATSGLRGVLEGMAGVLRTVAKNGEAIITFGKTLTLILGPRYLLGAIRAITAAIAANPFGLLAVGISTAVAAFPELQREMEIFLSAFQMGFSDLIKGIDFKGALLGIAGFIDGTIALFRGLLAAAGAIFDNIGLKPKEVGLLIMKGFRDGLEAVLKFFLAVGGTISNVMLGIGKDVILVLQATGGVAGSLLAGNLDAANSFADDITGAMSRSANRATTILDQFKGKLKQMEGIDILPDVKLTKEAGEIGAQVAGEFYRAIEESGTPTGDLLRNVFGDDDESLNRAYEAGVNTQKAFNEGRKQVPTPEEKRDISVDKNRLAVESLIEQLNLQKNLAAQEAILNEMMLERKENLDVLRLAYEELHLQALEASTSLGAGFERAFIKMKMEAEDLASVGEEIVGVFADRATDAITKFVQTGEFSFKEFANSILEDLTRILVRLLVIQAISAAMGGSGGGGLLGLLGGGTTATPRAEGGDVRPGRSYIVGEDGPELFTPNRSGQITPNGAPAPSAPVRPEVKIQVVNVDDPNAVPNAISQGRADEAILNVLARNPDRVNQLIR